MHELPLVFFTVFTQSAVGAFILLLIGGTLGQIDRQRMAVGLFSAMCLFGVGVLLGIFHVGQPLRALNMLLRVGHSPMSNEIVLSAVFATLGGLGALGLLLNRGAASLCKGLVWLAAAVGVVFIFAIPQIYQLPTVVTWRTSYTTVMMVLTPMIGGGILAGLFGLRLGLLVSVLAILVSFCLRPGYILTLMDADGVLTAAQSSWFTAQVVLLAVGIVGVVAWVRLKTNVAVLATTSLVVIAAELVGRIAFYNLWTLPM
ncbi:dimethyl sulfoxide reductase [Escherichia coli O157]|jgi:anaerobic dimethyl sulfoxide reductase subunit C (anchor subunit)|uniref:Dimethyl sulfoxide reductase anchor subunit n=1 Tax=Citrobacter pasteurii TaxID=1563222 RepID=A0ABX8KCP8_9ENTR|nr:MULTISPECIES: DmsC/YnfH family molybdoenzyme membrane anchor subunit [Enterobacteriaceae]EDY5828186.1 dimethyl sulfoxide reductase [Salmonella enterica subsp. enterica serovar Senftenberg]EJB8474367.1 dimethyl sulfoxide reductase anchor subunit [Citrobacter freundii]EJS7435831.1 dimethyl sulfoxide reductase anchor subunit [Salmonella enterica]ESA24474.1 Anaerobic dimethyl sulfoxide reductase chain C [Escherichia coli SCD1]EFD4033538.1 dimethyl sulfoxide reductase [Escherichia coli]